jgi:bile acid:Na+ symporter, BASS family
MHPVDLMSLNFDPNQRILLNICMGFLMFGIALDIRKADFLYLLKSPKPAIVGLFAQLVLIPMVTILFILIFNPAPSIALGMVVLTSCPGGNVSNFAAHLANGNTALSVTTTSLSTLAASITIPILYALQMQILGNHFGNLSIQISFLEMLKIVTVLIAIPLCLGMLATHYFPDLIEKSKKTIKTISMLIFIVFIMGAVAGNFNNLLQYIKHVFFIAIFLNIIGMLIGYYFAKWNGLSEADARSITFETSIHNGALGLLIAFTFFKGLGGMTLLIAWYGIWDMISSLTLAKYWSRKSIKV